MKRHYWKIELSGLLNSIMTTQMPILDCDSIVICTGLDLVMVQIAIDFVQRISHSDGTGFKTIWEAGP